MSDSRSSGTNLFGLLTIAFVILKLCRVIDWSWWWVLSPLWISVLVSLMCFIVAAIIKEISRKE
jgi:hypothetical protein